MADEDTVEYYYGKLDSKAKTDKYLKKNKYEVYESLLIRHLIKFIKIKLNGVEFNAFNYKNRELPDCPNLFEFNEDEFYGFISHYCSNGKKDAQYKLAFKRLEKLGVVSEPCVKHTDKKLDVKSYRKYFMVSRREGMFSGYAVPPKGTKRVGRMKLKKRLILARCLYDNIPSGYYLNMVNIDDTIKVKHENKQRLSTRRKRRAIIKSYFDYLSKSIIKKAMKYEPKQKVIRYIITDNPEFKKLFAKSCVVENSSYLLCDCKALNYSSNEMPDLCRFCGKKQNYECKKCGLTMKIGVSHNKTTCNEVIIKSVLGS